MAEAASASDAPGSLSGGNPLLRTELHIPHLRPDLVACSRLAKQIREGSERALTLIAALAGFDETTLPLNQLSCHSRRRALGLSYSRGELTIDSL